MGRVGLPIGLFVGDWVTDCAGLVGAWVGPVDDWVGPVGLPVGVWTG